jgi:hypothetical protein
MPPRDLRAYLFDIAEACRLWKRDFFAWEYKGRNKDLRAAYVQLMGYKDDLG